MADRYWVGGTGTWSNTLTTNWAATSGGASGASAPTSSDNVIFDANSNVGTGAFTVTCSAAAATCANFTAENLDGTMTLAGSVTSAILTVRGSWTNPSTNFVNSIGSGGTGGIDLTGGIVKTINFNGVSAAGSITFSGAGSVTLSSNITSTNTAATYGIVLNSTGSLDLNNFVLTGSSLSINSGFLGIAFGTTGRIDVTGNSRTVISTSTAGYMTGTPLIRCTSTANSGTRAIAISNTTEANSISVSVTGGSDTLSLGTSVYRDLTLTGFSGSIALSTPVSFFGNVTFSVGMATSTQSGTLSFLHTSGTKTFNSQGKTLCNITQNTPGSTLILGAVTTLGTSRNYNLTAGALDLATNNTALTASSLSSSNTNVRSIDFGTSATIILTETNGTIWNTNTATNFTWSGTANIYSNGTGGGSSATKLHDFGAITVPFTVTGGAGTSGQYRFNATSGFSEDENRITGAIASLDCSSYGQRKIGWITALTVTTGDFILGSTNIIGSTSAITFSATSGTQTLTTAGKAISSNITKSGVGGTLSLGDSLTLSGNTLTLSGGTFNANNYNLNIGAFSSSTTNVREVIMGSGTWTITSSSGWGAGATNLTITPNTSTIVLSNTTANSTTQFFGQGYTYNNLTFSNSNAVNQTLLVSSGVFNTITSGKTVDYIFQVSSNITCNTLTLASGLTNKLVLKGSSTPPVLTVSTGVSLDYATIQNVTLVGGGTVTNGYLVDSTTGWTLSTGSKYASVLTANGIFTVPATWNNADNSIHIIGGGGGGAGSIANNDVKGAGGGGGGGGYTALTNQSYTSGQTILYSAGAGGVNGPAGSPTFSISSLGFSGGASSWDGTQATISYVSSLATVTAASTSVLATLPSVSNGNLMVLVIVSSSSLTTYTTPRGWNVGTATISGRVVYWKIANSEPIDYTITANGTNNYTATILVYANAAFGTSGLASQTAASPITPAAINVPQPNSTILYVAFTAGAASITFSTPTGYTSRALDSDLNAPSTNIFELAGVTNGTYTAPSTTPLSGTANAFTIALVPSFSSSSASATGGGGGNSTTTTSTGGLGGLGTIGSVTPSIVGWSQGYSTGSSLTLSYPTTPSAAVAGDLLVLTVIPDNTGDTGPTTPTGWVLASSVISPVAVFWRIMPSSGSSVSITNSNNGFAASMVAFRNASFDTCGLIGAVSTTSVAPAIIVRTSNSIVVDTAFINGSPSRTFTVPTAYTSLDLYNSNAPSWRTFYKTGVSAGSSGIVSSTVSSGNAQSFLYSVMASSNYAGGTGGIGSISTVASTYNSGGGGGGAAGPFGSGGNGGNGISGTTTGTVFGGGGGGNGGGSNGGNATAALSGAGGNNYLGVGGGAAGSTGSNAGFAGGGSSGGHSSGTATISLGGAGDDVIRGFGSGGGSGGSGGGTGNTFSAAGNYGGGGGGGGTTNASGNSKSGGAGTQGAIIVVWTPVAVAPSGSTGNMFLMFF